MTRFALMIAFCLTTGPAFAESRKAKEADCGYQSDVVAAIQAARLERVSKANLVKSIAKSNPSWPDVYNNIIPILSGPIYDITRNDLRKVDLGAQWKTACLAAQ